MLWKSMEFDAQGHTLTTLQELAETQCGRKQKVVQIDLLCACTCGSIPTEGEIADGGAIHCDYADCEMGWV